MSRACLLATFQVHCWITCLLILQRNGPSAYQHVISALEGRRLQQEDEGLQPTSKPLYKVTGIKMLLASVRNELRLAKSKVPGKTSVMSWLQVGLSFVSRLAHSQMFMPTTCKIEVYRQSFTLSAC